MQSNTVPAATGSNVVTLHPDRSKIQSKRQDKFFAICADMMAGFSSSDELVDLLTIIVMSSGTGKDHASTSWSAQSVAYRLGIRWQSAANAIARLSEAGRLTSLIPKGKRPSARSWNYRLTVSADPMRRIWLPNTFVDGAADETSPVRRLIEMGDIKQTLLLLRCYEHLDMQSGGVDPHIISCPWAPPRTIDRANGYTLIASDPINMMQPTPAFLAGIYGPRDAAWSDDLSSLIAVGLLEWVTHARTGGPDGVNLGPVNGCDGGTRQERQIAQQRLERPIVEYPDKRGIEGLLMIRSHVANPIVVDVLRPRYLPSTHPVLAWSENIDSSVAGISSPIAM